MEAKYITTRLPHCQMCKKEIRFPEIILGMQKGEQKLAVCQSCYEANQNHDPVQRPAHYTQHSIECIEIARHFSFNIGNAVKYLWRAGYKDDLRQDFSKALFYLGIAYLNNDYLVFNPNIVFAAKQLRRIIPEFENIIAKEVLRCIAMWFTDRQDGEFLAGMEYLQAEIEKLPGATNGQN